MHVYSLLLELRENITLYFMKYLKFEIKNTPLEILPIKVKIWFNLSIQTCRLQIKDLNGCNSLVSEINCTRKTHI